MSTYSEYKGLELPTSPEHYDIAVVNKNNMVIDSELHKLDLKNESQDELLATKEALNAEISRAAETENTLSEKLNNETIRAVTSEREITNLLENEINRATSADETNSRNLTDHIGNKSNPHKVTKEQLGLGNVENKSSAAIRNEITNSNITKALGYTPYTPTEVDNKLSALETNIDWKESVATFNDIAATYPIPEDGWTVNVNDTDYTYRYNGETWIPISANAIPKSTNKLDGLMSAADKKKLDGIAAGANAYSLPAASSTTRGGVKIGYTANGKNYPVQLSNEQMYVNVPWTDTNTQTITGVKGNAESSYRTGNVNLTPGNIGAVSTADIGSVYNVRKKYTINLSSYANTHFYLLTFNNTPLEIDCEIHSQSGSGSMAYNQNVLHFLLESQGWSDLPKKIIILNHSVYTASEITIASVVTGNHNGVNGFYLRGGLTYTIYSNIPVTLRTSQYTYGDEIFPSGTATCYNTGFTNVSVLIDFTTSDNAKNFSKFSGEIRADSLSGNLTGNASSASRLTSRGNITAETDTNTPAVSGLSMSQAYNNGYPTPYGNILTMFGRGAGELFLGWSGTPGAVANLHYRNKRDQADAEWSPWRQIAFTTSDITGNAATATKLSSKRYINGMGFDGSANATNYGTCSTAASTVNKTVSCTGFSLVTGSEITVKFTVTNTASNPTLNVNGTGAKAIYYCGSAISAGNLAANRTYTFRYNGTQYELVGEVNREDIAALTKSISDLKQSFQDGVNSIYDLLSKLGFTPDSKGLDDILTSINEMYESRYKEGESSAEGTLTIGLTATQNGGNSDYGGNANHSRYKSTNIKINISNGSAKIISSAKSATTENWLSDGINNSFSATASIGNVKFESS